MSRPYARSVLVWWASALLMLASCAEVAGLQEHSLRPAKDAGEEPGVDGEDAWFVPTERCNFRDDNYDGVTDEGFDWVLGDWVTVGSDVDLVSIRAARLPGGGVGYGVSRRNGASEHDILVGIVNPDGQPGAGPHEAMRAQVLYGWDVAIDPISRELALAYVRPPVGEANCDGGCIFEMLRFDSTLTPMNSLPEVTDFHRHRVHELFALDWTTAGYVTLTKDQNGYAWMEWIDQLHFVFPNNAYGKLAGIRPSVARMAVGPGVAWTAMGVTDAGRHEVWSGVFSLGGYRSMIQGHAMMGWGDASKPFLGAGGPVAWGPTGAIVLMASDDDAHTALLLGAIETGKSRVAGQGTSLVSHSLAVVGTSLVASSVNGAQVSLWRWEEPPRTEGAAPFATFDGTLEHTVVAHGEPPMVFRVTQDGLLVQVALVNCVQL